MKNTTNCEVEKWSSSMQIFHALTRRRKTATAAAEWRNPQPARVRRWWGWGSEALPHQRWWKVAAALGQRARARGVRSSGVNEVWGGRGVFIGEVKNHPSKEIGRTCPWPFSFAWHVSPTYWEVEIMLDRCWIDKYIVGSGTVWAAKPKFLDKIS